MKYLPSLCITLLSCSALAGCASPAPCYENGAHPDALRSIYVVRRGWHTGVVVAAADWPNQSWSVLDDFRNVDYLEFGWGDERFYQAEENTFWLGLRAALWPTPSVVHVIGLQSPETARANEIVRVRVPLQGLRRLAAAIEDEFAERRPSPEGSPLAAAPMPNRFYEAKHSFFFPRMCNWWIATRLQEVGCAIEPGSVIAASSVMRKARGFARAEHGTSSGNAAAAPQ